MSSVIQSLSADQRELISAFEVLLREVNKKLNLISRGTESHIAERHILHSLALSWRDFPAGSEVIDWGTGGGLPLIPLAICFPGVVFHGVDSLGKKIQAVRLMARRLGLSNVHLWHSRAEAWPGQAQYSVSRATAPLTDLWHWHRHSFRPPETTPDGAWQPGLICLKGGDLSAEVAALKRADPEVAVRQFPLRELMGSAFFEAKYIVEVRPAIS